MTMRATIWGLMLCAPMALAAPLQPNDFAYGVELTFDGEPALVELTVPPEVYRAVTRDDLGDLRVFNGAGEVVPHALRAPAAQTVAPASHLLPMFPVYAGIGEHAEAVVMTVRRDAAGRIARVETAPTRTGERRIVAYVIDASALKVPLAAFDLIWDGAPPDYLGRVSLQASDDLARWSDVVVDAAVANLEFGGDRLARTRVEFTPRRARYLRLTWPADQPLPGLPLVKFDEVATTPVPQPLWEPVTLVRGAHAGEYRFVLPGRFPVERARIRMSPSTNRVVRAQVLARTDARAPWYQSGAGPVYRLKLGGVTLESDEFALAVAPRGECELRLMPPEGLENVTPAVELGWIPQRLVFVASGTGPFHLAYGATGVEPLGDSLRRVLADVDRHVQSGAIAVARTGEPIVLGGSERAAIPAPARWRQWVLWGTLLLAVGLLAGMAWRLGRSLGAVDPAKKGDVGE